MSTRYDKPIYSVMMNVETDKGVRMVSYVVSARNAIEAIEKAGAGTLVEVRLTHYDLIVVD